MTNVTVQEALKAAIEAMENEDELKPIPFGIRCIRAINKCKSALAEIEKYEPVAKLGRWMIDKSTGTDILTLDNCSVIEGKYANYIMGLLQKEIDKVVGELENTLPQQREWVDIDLSEYENQGLGGIAEEICEKLKQLNMKG